MLPSGPGSSSQASRHAPTKRSRVSSPAARPWARDAAALRTNAAATNDTPPINISFFMSGPRHSMLLGRVGISGRVCPFFRAVGERERRFVQAPETERLDQCRERSGLLPPARVIEEETGKGRAPVLEDAYERPVG